MKIELGEKVGPLIPDDYLLVTEKMFPRLGNGIGIELMPFARMLGDGSVLGAPPRIIFRNVWEDAEA